MSTCALCGYPVWHHFHSPKHPSNARYPELTHAFTVPGSHPDIKTPVLVKDEYTWKTFTGELLVVSAFFVILFVFMTMIEQVGR